MARMVLFCLFMSMAACSESQVENTSAQKAGQDEWATAVSRAITKPPWSVERASELADTIETLAQLDGEEVSELAAAALAGDAKSAWILRQYYAKKTPIDEAAVMKWERFAAEAGSSKAAAALGSAYENAGGEENCRRASFWWNRAGKLIAQEENRIDQTVLANLLALSENWQVCIDRSKKFVGYGGIE